MTTALHNVFRVGYITQAYVRARRYTLNINQCKYSNVEVQSFHILLHFLEISRDSPWVYTYGKIVLER